MRKKTEKTYNLNRKSIDRISSDVLTFLSECKVESQIIIQVRLALEELLLVLLNGISENEELKLQFMKRARRLWIVIEYGGRLFNPTDKKVLDSFSQSFLDRLRIKPVWEDRRGINRITITVPSLQPHTEQAFLITALLAFVVGAMRNFIPEGIRGFCSSYLLSPITELFMKYLNVITPPLIFLGLILNITQNRGEESQKLRKYVIGRYSKASIILTVISTIGMIPFFQFLFGTGSQSINGYISQLYKMILDLFPNNLVMALAEGNTPQIMILACFLGLLIRNLDNRAEKLNTTMDDLYAVFLNGIEYSIIVLPLFIFASLTSLLWNNGGETFLKLWKPILAIIAIYLLLTLGYIIYVAVKYRVSAAVLVRKIMPSTIIGLTTASSMSAFEKIIKVNRTLGLDESLTDFSVAIGMQLYCGAATPIYIAIVFYLAEIYHTPVEPAWFAIAGFISLIVSLATPPVSGGTMICLNIMLSALGIPLDGLAVASILALVFDFISTGSYIAMRHMEMVIQAGHLNLLDTETLRSKSIHA